MGKWNKEVEINVGKLARCGKDSKMDNFVEVELQRASLSSPIAEREPDGRKME